MFVAVAVFAASAAATATAITTFLLLLSLLLLLFIVDRYSQSTNRSYLQPVPHFGKLLTRPHDVIIDIKTNTSATAKMRRFPRKRGERNNSNSNSNFEFEFCQFGEKM